MACQDSMPFVGHGDCPCRVISLAVTSLFIVPNHLTREGLTLPCYLSELAAKATIEAGSLHRPAQTWLLPTAFPVAHRAFTSVLSRLKWQQDTRLHLGGTPH